MPIYDTRVPLMIYPAALCHSSGVPSLAVFSTARSFLVFSCARVYRLASVSPHVGCLCRTKFDNYMSVTLGLHGKEGDLVSERLWSAVDGQLKREVGTGVDCLLTRVKTRWVGCPLYPGRLLSTVLGFNFGSSDAWARRRATNRRHAVITLWAWELFCR